VRGGRGIPVCADLGNEEDAAALFRQVEQEQGRLDLMVDSAWGATIAEWSKPFWELSEGIWRDTAATTCTRTPRPIADRFCGTWATNS
jgi:NAD(P)-dependent dehydrogenase (short-subunit alcohol dehydrogenase family)